MVSLILSLLPLVFAYAAVWFLISLFLKRNDIADVAWGLGFVLVAYYTYLTHPITSLSLITVTLVSVWGLRLALHIYTRNRKKKEDSRYAAWRREWGSWFYVRSFFQVYVLQALLLLLVSFAPIAVILSGQEFQWYHAIGIFVWLFGFYFEAVGDFQLAKFIKNPANAGKIMTKGLWEYTRHPNYFGEVTQWWGIWLLTLPTFFAVWGIVGPLTITFLILKVSGIPMLEKKYEGNKEFESYKRRVSAFIPRFPQK